MKKLKYLSALLLIAMAMSFATAPMAMAVAEPMTESQAAIVLDMATGNTIYSKNEGEQRYPASLTKIMTVLLAVEAISRGEASVTDVVTASATSGFDLIADGSTAGIVEGETMTLENLLYCAMIQSANEACNIIAEHLAGSVSEFVARMNVRAQELGCTGTNFSNTHGLPSSSHYTTAKDFSLIALEASKHPLFMEVCNTAKKTIPPTNKSEARNLSNTNGLINAASIAYPGYFYEGAAGMKTGHTEAAGYCLISTATRNGVSLLAVIMGGVTASTASGATYSSFSDSIKLYDWAFENFSYRDVLKITDLIEDIPVAMGSNGAIVTVHPQKAVQMLLPNDDDLTSFIQKTKIYNVESGTELMAPISAGQVLGEISIERDGVSYGSSLLVASTSIDLSYSGFIKGRIVETLKKPLVIIFILIVLALLGAYIFLVVRYRASRKKFIQQNGSKMTAAIKPAKERKQKKVAPPAVENKEQASEIQFFDNTSDFEEEPIDEILTDEVITGEVLTDEGNQPLNEEQAERDYFEEFFGKK